MLNAVSWRVIKEMNIKGSEHTVQQPSAGSNLSAHQQMSGSKKLWYIYTMEFHAAERKKEFIPFATAWMELESIMLSKIS